ncbi:hypothetical protein ACFQZC_04635 [Streptacidiphilus monticola]
MGTGTHPHRRARRRALTVLASLSLALGAVTAFASPTPAAGHGTHAATPALTQVSSDPYSDTQAQHATEVEPDTYSYGSTVVSAFQVGRVSGGGASNIGWATSTDGGQTWTHGFMPGSTTNTGARTPRPATPRWPTTPRTASGWSPGWASPPAATSTSS